MEKSRNYLVDAVKCIACFVVVMLHYPTKEFQWEVYTLQTIIGRCGVPVFFMISGYFAGLNKRVKDGDTRGNNWYLKQALKMLKYFLIFSLIYFLFYKIYDLILVKPEPTVTVEFSVEKIINLLLFNQPFFSGILWYLLAFAYCLLIYWLASFFKAGFTVIAAVSPFLMIGYYVLGRYSRFFFENPIPSYYASNFLFAAIPMFTIGFWIPKMKFKKLTTSNICILTVVSLMALFAEGAAFRMNDSVNSGRNNFIFNTVVAFLIIYYIANDLGITVAKDNILAVIGRKYSLYIYAFQGMANAVWVIIFHFLKGTELDGIIHSFYNIFRPFMMFLTALLMAMLYYFVSNRISVLRRKVKGSREGSKTKVA